MKALNTTYYIRRLVQKVFHRNPSVLELTKISSLEQYRQYSRSMKKEYDRRKTIELQWTVSDSAFYVPGFCYVCSEDVNFYSDFMYAYVDERGRRMPNWRERLLCPRCGLNNRMRASIHVFHQQCNPDRDDVIYLTEQITPMFSWFQNNYPNVIGSEYLGNTVPRGTTNSQGIRNESISDLTFPDAQFDYILSFDVFEHVPDFQKAFYECSRCLKPHGTLFFTIPFDLNLQENLVRAKINYRGEIEHILPPEYHGDPLNKDGCLCYHHFGWEVIDQLCNSGFSDIAFYFYWSMEYGYLGLDQFVLIAQK